MPRASSLSRFHKQTITHWVPTGDGYGGFSYSTPVALKGRWQSNVEKMVTLDGEEFVSQAHIWLSVVVNVGDYLFKGTSVEADPNTVGASRVRIQTEIPSIRGTFVERKVIL